MDLRGLLARSVHGMPERVLRSAPWLMEPRALLILTLVLAVLLILISCIIAVRLRVRRKTRDLERRVMAQMELTQAAELANKKKGEFLANMTHGIRTPMNAIMGFTDLVLKRDLDPELREYLATVRISAEWLMHIINDVLEFSRMEAGALQIESTEFCFAECLRSAIKIIQPEATARNLAVRCNIDSQIPAVLCGDPTRLRQVAFNLLDNAVKFTTTGSVMLSAVLEAKSADSVLTRISVADTGIGIPAHKQQFIFQPFTPAAEASRGKAAGPGLGLAISRKLVDAMGGSIEVQSQLGAGSTFQFTAWFRKTQSSRQTEKRSNSAGSARRPLSILIAEDNAVNRRLMTKLLESAGHEVTPASNGKDAVRLFETAVFDLILMDLEMPLLDGLEATHAIRASEPEGSRTPIFALTAHVMAGDRERCFAAGMDGYISKPIEVDAVLKLVAEIASSGARYSMSMQSP